MTVAELTKPRAKAQRPWTYDEMLAELPETNLPTELWDGELVMSPTPNPSHQTIVLGFARLLQDFVASRKAGTVFISPLDVVLSPHRVVQPDLFFISTGRSWIVSDKVRGAPDLVIEVLSPNPRIGRTEERVQWFAEYGVRECWLLDQQSVSMAVLQFANQRVMMRTVFDRRSPIVSGVLPEFGSSVSEMLR